MSQDAKNSILLWVGALIFFGVFWALVHFDIVVDIPDRWLWPVFAILIGANVAKAVWGYFRRRKAKVS